MIWQIKDLSEWHEHFCLWPVEFGGKGYWLETVERRCTGSAVSVADVHYFWEYRERQKNGTTKPALGASMLANSTVE